MDLENNPSGDFFTRVNPLLKMLFGVLVIILTLSEQNSMYLIGVIFLIILLSLVTKSLVATLERLWGMKFFFLSFLIFYALFFPTATIQSVSVLFIQILIIITTFNLISRSLSPDALTQALIDLKLPPQFAWTVGLTLRQVFFIGDEISTIWEIYQKRVQSQPGLRSKIGVVTPFITSTLAMSIQRSKQLQLSLRARGYKKADKYVITYVDKSSKSDFLFLSLFVSPLIILLLVSSQIFNSQLQ
ncbi:MAG: energy-coupling factor transporter transmembrane component T family protein [Candidatus Kariarchaeaceae archaeon]|jgi:energy-coupling factor transporter transmembrane protein EcfT